MLLKEKFNDVQLPWRQKARQAMHSPKGEAPVSFGRQTGAKGKHDPWSFSEEKTGRGRAWMNQIQSLGIQSSGSGAEAALSCSRDGLWVSGERYIT